MKQLGVLEMDGGQKVAISVSEPTRPPAKKLTEEEFHRMMREQQAQAPVDGAPFRHFVAVSETFGRTSRQYKSLEFLVSKELMMDAFYWCEFFHGGDSIVSHKFLPGGMVAVYSEYKCW
jgi:hypothetical protein